MSSINTNPGAQTALQTLKSINSELAVTRSEIATGRRVATSEDNAAVWAIAKTMEADVAGFKRASDSLNLGQATVSVARQGAETITDLLTQIKGKVVAAQEGNVDRAKIQSDIAALTTQIQSVVDTASFNGTGLLKNMETTAGSGSIGVLGSINRTPTAVTSSDITIRKRDLGTAAQGIAATGGTFAANAATATLNATQTATMDLSSITVQTGMAFSISVFGTDADGSAFDQAALRTTAGASQTQAEMASGPISYVARDGDGMGDVLYALKQKFDAYALSNDIGSDTLDMSYSGSTLRLSSGVTDATDTIGVAFNTLSASAGNTIGGGLGDLSDLDVTTASGARDALGSVESLLTIAIDSAAALGSDQKRLETQDAFVGKLSDALKSGIGTLVDADLEETSARLQALQVQQQLAQQALSIANQAPGVLLGLFR
ncbi:flagellin [Thetidibacter halocola]|uniref:Flagellin n=1 Tax=Thetidibacter halocola TaxID=2827239 RepID=A0A8J7WCS9_9RHOB|nr:flagellin [Thetidibacter halocola]MBS0125210.1 flagellin [Thetidibacter halocola]